MTHPIVTIVAKSVPEYRLAFFNGLRSALKREGVQLRVVHGQPSPRDETHVHATTLDWGTRIDNRSFTLSGRQLIWQPCLKLAAQSDLVIVEQASKLLVNHLLFALHHVGRIRLAFWGHGQNLNSPSRSKIGEGIKSFESKRVHWWFAYTDRTVKVLHSLGFPRDRTTLVENTIDVGTLQRAHSQLTSEDLDIARRQVGIRGNNCALYIGGMYAEKRLPFLLDAARIIRSRVPDFELVMVGAGPDEVLARRWANDLDWVHYAGSQPGEEKVPYFALTKLLLLPGAVGLTIVDSFTLRVPMLTVSVPYHGPEMSYLRNHENGVMLPEDTTPAAYAQEAAALLGDEPRRQHLIRGCDRSADRYGLENMVRRFCDGVVLALARRRDAR